MRIEHGRKRPAALGDTFFKFVLLYAGNMRPSSETHVVVFPLPAPYRFPAETVPSQSRFVRHCLARRRMICFG